MKQWAEERWFPVIKNRPIINILFNGWVVFHFLNSEDMNWILKVPSVKGRGFLILQRWKARFDPLERLGRQYIWAKLQGLPLELWNEEVIKEITNKIGNYYYLDVASFKHLDKRMAWVLIEVELGRGLTTELEIHWSNFSFTLAIDY